VVSNIESIETVLDTTGNGTTTFTLSKAVGKVLTTIDGIVQRDFTQPNGTNQLVFGFIPDTTENVTAYSFNNISVGGGGGASTLDELTNVNAPSPTEDQILS